MPKLSIVIPCYFNEKNIPQTMEALSLVERELLGQVEIEYVFVDDGSKDMTYKELLKIYEKKPHQTKIVKLARNFGAYNAVLAGLGHANGDVLVTLSADLQDPPELIPKMLEYWKKGIKLVIANREAREESFLQSSISNTFHYLMRKFALQNTPDGGFDLVLFDRQIRDDVVRMNESNMHLHYLMIWLGYDYVSIPYVRRKRDIGKSRWTLQKKIKAFIDSFVAFSYFPVRAIGTIGIVLGAGGLLYMATILFSKVFGKVPIEGWTSLMVVLLLVSSFQMISLGIIGEYLWRTLDSARRRPSYIVDQVIEAKKA